MSFVAKIEDEMNTATSTFVVIDKHENDIDVKGIFSSYELAKRFLTREIVIEALESVEYMDSMEDGYELDNLRRVIQAQMFDNNHNGLQIIIVTHLDLKKPMYKIVDKRNNSRGNPYQYLTNSSSHKKFQTAVRLGIDPNVRKHHEPVGGTI